MHTINEVFNIINNLDWREALRKYGPNYCIVMVNSNLQIESVTRFKKQPKGSERSDLITKHKGCVYFVTRPGMYSTVKELEDKVLSCEDAFSITEHEQQLKDKSQGINYPYTFKGISVRGRSDK